MRDTGILRRGAGARTAERKEKFLLFPERIAQHYSRLRRNQKSIVGFLTAEYHEAVFINEGSRTDRPLVVEHASPPQTRNWRSLGDLFG